MTGAGNIKFERKRFLVPGCWCCVPVLVLALCSVRKSRRVGMRWQVAFSVTEPSVGFIILVRVSDTVEDQDRRVLLSIYHRKRAVNE